MEYNEKDVEEYLNQENVKAEIETNSNIIALIQMLIDKNIIIEEEFLEARNKTRELIKEEIKKIIKQRIENGEV